MVDFSKLLELEDAEVAARNYLARLAVNEVDPQTGLIERNIVPELKLPVQGVHDYVAGSGDNRPFQWFPSVAQGVENVKAISEEGFDSPKNIKNKLFGTEGVERFQAWPEKMVRSGVSLPFDVMANPGMLSNTPTSDLPGATSPYQHTIERAQDLAGLAAGGSVVSAGAAKPKAGTLAARLTEHLEGPTIKFAEDSEAGSAIAASKNSLASRLNEHLNETRSNIGNKTMPEILARQRASEGYEAAIRDPETKKLYTGMWHEEVLDKIAKDRGIPKDQLPTNLRKGYVDHDGKFWTEQQLENKSRSRTAMFRADDEAGTAIAAVENSNKPRTFWRGFNEGDTRRIKTGNENWDKHLFVSSKIDDAKMYGNSLSKYEALPEAKILYESSKDFVNIAGKWRKNESMLDFASRVAEAAKAAGYDAVHFKRQGDIGTAIFNPSKFKLLSDDIVGTGLAAVAPRFYSHVEKLTADAPANKMTTNEWRSYLKNKGATVEELEALKLHDLLGEERSLSSEGSAVQSTKAQEALNEWRKTNKGKPPEDLLKATQAERDANVKAKTIKDESPTISKEELQKHLNDNKVELQETWKGINVEERNKLIDARNRGEITTDELAKRVDELEKNGPARFAQYQLSNGTNYRELLMSVKDNPGKIKRIGELNREILKLRGGDKTTPALQVGPEIAERIGNLTTELRDLENSFTTNHWPGTKDIVVHSRMNDRFIPDENGPSKKVDRSSGQSSQDLIKTWGYTPQEWKNLTQEQRNKIINNDHSTIKGLNTLHAEEIQSDWLQKGNSEGFKYSSLKEKNKYEPEFNRIDEKIINSGDESVMANPDLREAVKMAVDKKIITEAEAKTYLRYSDSERFGAVKDAPFKSTWSDLMVKRLIRQAVEEGKDAVSWTPGQAQADRYNLAKHIDDLHYNKSRGILTAYKNGETVVTEREVTPDKLSSFVGKEVANKLLQNEEKFDKLKIRSAEDGGGGYEIVNENGTVAHASPDRKSAQQWLDYEGKRIDQNYRIKNTDLTVGGEFHKKFYDEILVNKVNAIAKKYGGKVEEHNIETKQHISKPTGLFEETKKQPIWVLRLTPELKKAAMEKGFSMFEMGLPLSPVQGNPFSEQQKKYKLIPVPHNPFELDK